jgi:predicted phage baseplate assembly protein
MSAWWGREAWGPVPDTAFVRGRSSEPPRPRPLPVSRDAVARDVAGRIASFTPEWTNQRPTDPGTALTRVFSEEMEAVLARADRLPEKMLVEFLGNAGVASLPAQPAEALLAFTLSSGAAESVLVPAGFQVGAPPATGEGDLVIFETTRALFAAPATLAELHVEENGVIRRIPVPSGDDAAPFEPFGRRAEAGRALYIGLATEDPAARLLNRLTLGIAVFAPPGAPPPVPAGGVAPLPVPPPPFLRWELLDGSLWKPLEVAVDQTGGLVRSGVIEIELPASWRPGTLPRRTGPPLRWLRFSILYGRYAEPPSLRAILINVAPAVAARTIRDEALEPVPGSGGGQFRLSQTPVLPRSLIVEVDEGAAPAPLVPEAEAPAVTPPVRRWSEVESLADAGPDDRVYVLDPATGVLQFGDGVHGAAVPDGFRNVRALVYQVGGGAVGAVDADTITTQLSSAPFVTGVTNPLRATGGMDAEPAALTRRRGPQEIRARNRAVAVADYELMAVRAPGAQVVRAHAVSGLHPAHPGIPIPGVVGVYVVPPDRGEGPPTPDEGTLRAVAEYLSATVAPAGVQVVAGAPFYHKVRAEIGVVIDPAADQGDTVRRLTAALDAYIHPLAGGEDGTGWPFGAALRYSPLLRRLVTGIDGVRAITRLTLVIDGARVAACTDFAPRPHALFWPTPHEVVPVDAETRV